MIIWPTITREESAVGADVRRDFVTPRGSVANRRQIGPKSCAVQFVCVCVHSVRLAYLSS